jgi:hypothetical protein
MLTRRRPGRLGGQVNLQVKEAKKRELRLQGQQPNRTTQKQSFQIKEMVSQG